MGNWVQTTWKPGNDVDVSVHYIYDLVETQGFLFHTLPQMTISPMDHKPTREIEVGPHGEGLWDGYGTSCC
jgi:hypothetical protein